MTCRSIEPHGSHGFCSAARLGLLILLGSLAFPVPLAFAHTADQSYLTFRIQGTNISGQLDVARRDIAQGIAISGINAASLSAEERARREEAFALDLVGRLEVRIDEQPVTLDITDFTTLTLNSGEYARVMFAAPDWPRPPGVLRVNCRVLFSIDKSMHGLLRLEHNGRTEAVAYTVDTPAHQFSIAAPGGRWSQWLTFVVEGIWHIWIGFDHILFLIALLLPAVFRRNETDWVSVERFSPAVINVLKIVTAFTVAHSITLSLAALEIVTLPSQWVESAIAGSVILAATNNLYPWFKDKGWLVAFGFGLIHGFGFANVLGELGLSRATLALALVGFNVGVEIGQLAIVAVFLPVAFFVRQGWFYRVLVFKVGSVVVILIAGAWMIERIFSISLLSR